MEQPGTDILSGRSADATRASDERLLSAFLEGDETMFSALVHRYEQPLHAFICRVTGEPADAADLFQETFVRVYQKAGTFRSDSSLKTWLYSIAVNLCRSQMRKRRGELHVPIEAGRGVAVHSRPGPNGLEAEEIGSRVAAAVKRLPLEQREVFVLRVYDEMTYGDISAALERPLGTVKSQMRSALAKLRGDLRDIARAYGVA